jgi:anti-sigma factor RsiW
MDCEQWQHQLLLAESGELSDDKRQALDTHLTGCPACRDFRNVSLTLADAVRPMLRHGEPAAATMAAISRETASASGRSHLLVFHPTVVRIAACAAAFTLVIGGWFFLRPGTKSNSDAIHQVGSLLTMVSEQHASNSGVPAVSASNSDTRLRALARELLRMEGLALDEVL